jgi:hypothetical protein
VGPFAVIATGIGSAIAAGLLAARMASLRRERTSGIVRDALGAALLNGLASAALAGPAGLAVLFYARELWAAAPEGERSDPRLLLEIAALVIATAAAVLWIGVSL